MAASSKEECLIDTNILVYALDNKSPFFQKAKEILNRCLKREIQGVVAHQNLVELIAILVGIYKISLRSAAGDAKSFISGANLRVIHPRTTTLLTFFRLLKRKRRVDIFDYYLTATMIDNGVKKLLTKNKEDFQGIKAIKAIDPF